MAVLTPPDLLAVFVWIGIGGVISAYAGPYFVGLYWEKTTEKAVLIAMILSFTFFLVLYVLPSLGIFAGRAWYPLSGNPFASAGLGLIISIVLTVVGSFFTSPPPEDHIDYVFRTDSPVTDGGTPEAVAEHDDQN